MTLVRQGLSGLWNLRWAPTTCTALGGTFCRAPPKIHSDKAAANGWHSVPIWTCCLMTSLAFLAIKFPKFVLLKKTPVRQRCLALGLQVSFLLFCLQRNIANSLRLGFGIRWLQYSPKNFLLWSGLFWPFSWFYFWCPANLTFVSSTCPVLTQLADPGSLKFISPLRKTWKIWKTLPLLYEVIRGTVSFHVLLNHCLTCHITQIAHHYMYLPLSRRK